MSPIKNKPKAVKPAISEAPAAPETPTVPADTATPSETPSPAPAVPPAADLNQPDFPLHPERIWPD